MMRRLAMVLVTALALSGCGYAGLQDLPLPGSPPVGNDPFTVTAQFTNVLDLTRDATVKLNGVTVGRVDAISRHGWTADVRLTLQQGVDVPNNVQAQIRQTGLLGEQYVALVAPADSGAQRLRGGDVIAASSTGADYDVEQVLGALSLLLNGGGLNQVQTITVQLRNALVDAGATKAFIAQLDQFVGTLDRNQSLIVSTMRHMSALSATLATEHGTVSTALDSIAKATTVLADQQRQVRSMLHHLDGFSQAASAVVRTSGANLVSVLDSLQPVLDRLQKAGKQLPEVIGTVLSFPFPDDVLTAVKGDYVNLDVLVNLSPLVLAGNFAPGNVSLTSLAMLSSLLGLGNTSSGNGIAKLAGTLTLLRATGGTR